MIGDMMHTNMSASGQWFKSPLRVFLTEYHGNPDPTIDGFAAIAAAADRELTSVLAEDFHRKDAA